MIPDSAVFLYLFVNDSFMANFSVIIIGAGAAGLLAARDLSRTGFSVLLLEAAETPGGRIHTLQGREQGREEARMERKGFSGVVEAGAEFVHGPLPITLRLLEEAGISLRPIKGRMVEVHKGRWGQQNMFAGQWDELMQKMAQLEKDIPIADFLAREFPGEKYAGLRESVQRFAEGYDLADIHTASTRALYAEWQEEGQEEYRIDGGYSRLIHFLADQCQRHGCRILTASPVKEIQWQPGRVEVGTAGGERFTGDRLLITIPLGILQMDPAQSAIPGPSPDPIGSSTTPPAALQFFPPIPDYIQAARQLGYGSVIKILMEFHEPFWKEKGKGVSFILSDEEIPTWWLQSPDDSNLLTGWLTGAALFRFQGLSNDARLTCCLQSLASIFDRNIDYLKGQLKAFYIADWPSTPFIQGGYSFDTVEGQQARNLLSTPLQKTLFFAGEALYEGPSPATVEAAFTSGQEAAKKIREAAKK
ncbi:MAG TPA: NAD(P)/FAD-dependent oxidoreductase [Puia sp.]|nr:NAD(P)/FAD-dependent oxidoreductase [Puia sp.]